MICIVSFISLIASITSSFIAIISFKESRKLNNKWKISKRMKTEPNCGFKMISC